MPTVPFYDFDTDFALKVRQTIRVVQSDIGREFVCHAKFNGQAWDLTGFTGTVLGVKPDGNATDTTATIDEDEFKFTLTEQMAAVAGAYEIFLTVENGSDVKIQAPVLLCVLEGADGVISESALGALTELLQASQEAATAATASAEDAEDAADRAEAAADSILVDNTDRTPYLLRQSGGGVETGDREYDTIVGGAVAWNQLISTASKDFTNTTTDTRANFQLTIRNMVAPVYNYVTKTVSTAGMLAGVFKPTTIGVGISVVHNGSTRNISIYQTNQMSFKDGHAYLYSINAESVDVQTEGGLVLKDIQIFDLTQMFGSTIADYIYNLEQATAGAGVAWFRQFFSANYYEYNAGELKSVSGVSAHVMRDADNNIIGNYPLDDSLTLRGLPKLDDGKLYYDGDTYESDGTVTRRYGIVTITGTTGTWMKSTAYPGGYYVQGWAKNNSVVNSPNHIQDKFETVTNLTDYGAKTNVVYFDNSLNVKVDNTLYPTVEDFKTYLNSNPIVMVYELATPTTETADPFTNPQVVDPDGTEQYVTTSIVPVGHETIYRTNLLDNLNNILKAPTADGTYTMKVTVSNGEATYFWD